MSDHKIYTETDKLNAKKTMDAALIVKKGDEQVKMDAEHEFKEAEKTKTKAVQVQMEANKAKIKAEQAEHLHTSQKTKLGLLDANGALTDENDA